MSASFFHRIIPLRNLNSVLLCHLSNDLFRQFCHLCYCCNRCSCTKQIHRYMGNSELTTFGSTFSTSFTAPFASPLFYPLHPPTFP